MMSALACGAARKAATVQPLPEPPYEEVLGIHVESVRTSAHGMIVDLRYRVLEPAKAQNIVTRKTPMTLIHDATGQVLSVPAPAFVGPMRQTADRAVKGNVYFVLFENRNRTGKPGDTMTLKIGDVLVKGLKIE